MGIYGIFQYLVAPDWDSSWLTNTGMVSAGSPEPLEIRVWSTMHSPGVFAVFMMGGLLLLLHKYGVFWRSTSIIGYLVFLLTLVRGAWVMWVVGLLTHLSFLKFNLKIRIVIIMTVLALGVIPLTTVEPFAQRITPRIETLFDLENDQSSNERKDLYRQKTDSAFTNFLGNGMVKQDILDSGVIDILSSLGWFGGFFYLSGILLLILRLFMDTAANFNLFVSISLSISFCSLVGLVFGRQQIGAPGMILWSFLSIGMAASRYYLHKRSFTRIKIETIDNR